MHRAWVISFNVFLWVFFVVSSLVLFLGAVLIRILTAPFDPNRRVLHQYSCFWGSIYIWVNLFWTVRVSGLENVDRHKAYVMVSNHQSMADILVLFRSFLHFKWVSKKSMFKAPMLGWNMWLNGYVPIERGDAASREKCFAQCRRWLKKGSSVLFFPEGTRSNDGRLKPFKIGAFRLACETGCDILPMVIRGSCDAIPIHSVVVSRHSKMELEVLPPISVEKVSDDQLSTAAEQLAQECHNRIAAAFETSP